MRRSATLLLALALGLGLAGCGDGAAPTHGPRPDGRFLGIGVYAPGPLWQRLIGAAPSDDDAAATLGDDEQIIVVVDSRTGEIRQCGNLSGHCIRLNPWSGERAPARLSAHAAELEAAGEGQGEAAAKAAAPAPR